MNILTAKLVHFSQNQQFSKERGVFLTSIFLLITFCYIFDVYADIYKYTDDTGSVCITNSLEKVPKRFRSSMTVVKEDVLQQSQQKKMLPEAQKRTTDPVSAPQGAQVQTEPQNEVQPLNNDSRKKFINTAAIIAGLVAIYFILGKISEYIGFQRVGTVLFLMIVLTGGVYLYGMYIKELSAVYASLRKDAQGVRQNVETRDLKTDQMLKQLEDKPQAKEE